MTKELYIQKTPDTNTIRSGVNLTKVVSFTVDRLPGTINVFLTLVTGSYVVSFTTEEEVQKFVAKLEAAID
jgi:hypothetical protein